MTSFWFECQRTVAEKFDNLGYRITPHGKVKGDNFAKSFFLCYHLFMKKQNIVIIVLALVAILGGMFAYLSSNKTETTPIVPNPIVVQNTPTTTPVVDTGIEKIDEHLTINNELRDVNFCGKTYKVKQVLIDGADVVQRVAELANKDALPKNVYHEFYGTTKSVFISEKMMKLEICDTIKKDASDGVIEINYGTHYLAVDPIWGTEDLYPFYLAPESLWTIAVVSPADDLYILSVQNNKRSIYGPIGNLK